jgi:hypothetical protein
MLMTKASRIRTSFAAGKFVVGAWACAMPSSIPAAPAAAAVFISARRVMVMRSLMACSSTFVLGYGSASEGRFNRIKRV